MSDPIRDALRLLHSIKLHTPADGCAICRHKHRKHVDANIPRCRACADRGRGCPRFVSAAEATEAIRAALASSVAGGEREDTDSLRTIRDFMLSPDHTVEVTPEAIVAMATELLERRGEPEPVAEGEDDDAKFLRVWREAQERVAPLVERLKRAERWTPEMEAFRFGTKENPDA